MSEDPLFSFIDDTISKIEEFTKTSEKYFDLSRTICDLFHAKRQNSTTKQVLLLRNIGSEKNLCSLCDTTYQKLNRFLEEINSSYQALENLLQTKEMKCQRCGGDGYTYKYKYHREKGQPTQRILSSEKCMECTGKGIIILNLNSKQEYVLKQFIYIGKILQNNIKSHLKCIENLIKTVR